MHLQTTEKDRIATNAFSPEERSRIVEENIGLVGSVVKRFANMGYDMEDLFQIGCVGLVKAVERFDFGFGVKLSTYAVPVILGEIKRHLRDDGVLRISRSIKTNALHIRRFVEQQTKLTGEAPTVSEVATKLGLQAEEVLLAMEALRPMQYLQAEDADSGFTLMDTLAAPDTEEHLLDRLALNELIKTLPEREQRLILLRYFENQTQMQTAAKLGISQVQVSRLEKKLLLKLRALLSA